MPEGMVEALMTRDEPKESLFQRGDRVRVSSGPFAGLEGVFDEDDSMNRVVILLEFMHKQQRLSVPVGDVRQLT